MGDYIQVDNYQGLVTRIGTFFFTLEQQNAPEFIKIPNSIILSKPTFNRGNGKYREELKMPLKHAPADLQERLKELNVFIRTRNVLKDPVKTQVIADGNGWYVYISFNTSFQQDSLKSAVYAEALQQLSDCLHFSS